MNNDDDYLNCTQNIAHPSLEATDPTPDIHVLFFRFNEKFFQGKLTCVELEWSTRMYSCAGICYANRIQKVKSCTIRLSEPLLKLRSRKELIETLLHEMIHAFLFVLDIREGNGGHGPNFLRIAAQINKRAGTNITVYHNFHDEVELYKRHWWRCTGPCRHRAPYYGWVKRTSNRAPSSNDFWWQSHKERCSGTFQKVREPSPVKKKKFEKKTTGGKRQSTPPKPPLRKSPWHTPGRKPGGGGTMVTNPGSGTLVIRKPPQTKRKADDDSPSPTTVASPGGIQTIFGPVGRPTTSTPTRGAVGGASGNLTNVKTINDVTGSPKAPPGRNRPIFTGRGQALGGSGGSTNTGPKRSRLLDQPSTSRQPKPVETITLDDSDEEDRKIDDFMRTAIANELFGDDDDIILIDSEFDDKKAADNDKETESQQVKDFLDASHDMEEGFCPICSNKVDGSMQQHLEICVAKLFETSQPSASEKPSTTAGNQATTTLSGEEQRKLLEEAGYDEAMIQQVVNDEEDSESIPERFPCPNCPLNITLASINDHLDFCLQSD